MQITADVNTDATKASIESLKHRIRSGAVDAVQVGADVIVEACKQVVPIITGHLRDSITAEFVVQSSTLLSMSIHPDTPYAVMVEYGHSRTHNPTPYMQIAFDSSLQAATLATVDVMNQALE